jgi:peroxiredoxin
MAEKLNAGAQFPELSLNHGDDTILLPSPKASGYSIILFYRGHWWPFCRRLLDGYAERIEALNELGTSVVAASHDDRDKAEEVGSKLPFPVAHGVTIEQGNLIGAWWDQKRDFIQPSEFILNHKGRVLHSTYSSSPVGRTDPEEALVLLGYLSSR